MAGVTRVVGLGVTAGTLYSHNVKAYLITVQVAGNTDVDLRAEDDAVDEAAEMIMKEISPLMYFVKNDASGEICVIMDGNSSAADIQARIRQVAGNTDVDLRAEDDAVDEAAEMIMKEISPLMYFVKNDASGEICVIMDGNSSAADIQARIRALGTAVGPNDIDVTGTDVTLSTSLTTA